MSKRDSIHFAVVHALEKEEWEIIDDPFEIDLEYGKKYKADLGAEKFISAAKGAKRIVVEIKGFSALSVLHAFHEAFGQYLNYRDALIDSGIEREIYIALSEELYFEMTGIPFLKRQLLRYNFKIIVIDIEKENIVQWIN